MGSDSDVDTMQAPLEVRDQLGIERGCAVSIAAAGLAAYLAGTVAALTVEPVIGVPRDAGPLKGQDARP